MNIQKIGDRTAELLNLYYNNEMMPGSKHRIFYISTSARTLKI